MFATTSSLEGLRRDRHGGHFIDICVQALPLAAIYPLRAKIQGQSSVRYICMFRGKELCILWFDSAVAESP